MNLAPERQPGKATVSACPFLGRRNGYASPKATTAVGPTRSGRSGAGLELVRPGSPGNGGRIYPCAAWSTASAGVSSNGSRKSWTPTWTLFIVEPSGRQKVRPGRLEPTMETRMTSSLAREPLTTATQIRCCVCWFGHQRLDAVSN